MPYVVQTSEAFGEWYGAQDKSLRRAVAAYIGLLEEHGPQLGRPYADTLTGSRLSNLKELRVQHRSEPYRILYAFDPKRQALLLLGGNKAGDDRRYRRMIPLAEAIYQRHLETLAEED